YASHGGFIVSSWEIVPYLFLGLVAGASAPLFLRLLRASETIFARLPLPFALRLALGGLVVGAISVALPEVWGNGSSVISDMLHNNWDAHTVALLLVAKLLATAATVGSGAVGGVFTPTLFVGAAMGLLFEQGYHTLWPQMVFDARPYALVGMGSFLAATTHAPLMAIIMLFEMTLDYDIVLPLMLACVTAYYTATSLDTTSVYSEALKQRLGRTPPQSPALRGCIADVLKPHPQTIARAAPLVDIARAFARSQNLHLYVTDADDRFEGTISLMDIKDFFEEPYPSTLVTAFDLMHGELPLLTPQMSLNAAAMSFLSVLTMLSWHCPC
ncbi:MAG: chloride channel protein, partial [Deltaproteobacteria bacterium]